MRQVIRSCVKSFPRCAALRAFGQRFVAFFRLETRSRDCSVIAGAVPHTAKQARLPSVSRQSGPKLEHFRLAYFRRWRACRKLARVSAATQGSQLQWPQPPQSSLIVLARFWVRGEGVGPTPLSSTTGQPFLCSVPCAQARAAPIESQRRLRPCISSEMNGCGSTVTRKPSPWRRM